MKHSLDTHGYSGAQDLARLLNVALVLLMPCWICSSLAQTVVSTFDDAAPGVTLGDSGRGILYPEWAQVVNVAQMWPWAATSSGSNALQSNDGVAEGRLLIGFSQRVNRVRMRVGNPANGWDAEVVVRAYTSATPGAPPVAVARVSISGYSGITTPVEVDRIFDGDIVMVSVQMSGQANAIIDDLEYEVLPASTFTTVNFDDPARQIGERIQNQYDGLSFPDLPVIADGRALGTSSTPRYLRSPIRGEVSDPLPLQIRLNPPQGAVRMMVGSDSPSAVTVTCGPTTTSAGLWRLRRRR